MKNRKFAVILMCVVVMVSLFSGCSAEEYSDAAQVEGAIFGGKSDDSISTKISFDFDWITKEDNTSYNGNLAAFSALLCADSYYREKDFQKGTQNRVLPTKLDGEYSFTSLLQTVGFVDVKHVESYKEKEYFSDSNDSVTMTLGHVNLDGKYDVYAIVFRGCFSAQEWVSAFDPGCDGEQYEELTGEHREWTNPNHLKGLDIALNRALEFIDEFMSQYDDPDIPDCVLFTGHSRGGSLANMVGAEYERHSKAKIYTYTFNAMPVTNEENAGEYETIFNIFDTSDFYVNPMPFGKEHFCRYGKDMSLCIDDSPEIIEAIAILKGRDDYTCIQREAFDKYEKMFAQRFPDRISLYQSVKITEVFETEQEALARADECRSIISGETGLDLGEFCRVEEIYETDDGKYAVAIEYCGAALLKGYSKVLAYGEAAYEAFLSLFDGDGAGCEIAELLIDNTSAINGGHLLINGYVLTEYIA